MYLLVTYVKSDVCNIASSLNDLLYQIRLFRLMAVVTICRINNITYFQVNNENISLCLTI